MQTTVTFNYSPELVKQVSRRFIWYQMKQQYILVGILGLYGILTLLMGDRGLLQGIGIGLLAIYFAQWVNYWRNATKVAQELANRSVTVQFNDEGVIFQTIDHTSIAKWQRIKTILKFQEAWLFFMYSNFGAYTMVPAKLLTEELKIFIRLYRK